MTRDYRIIPRVHLHVAPLDSVVLPMWDPLNGRFSARNSSNNRRTTLAIARNKFYALNYI